MPVAYQVPLTWKNVFPNYFVQETDPSLDAGNNVTAYKRWIQIDDDAADVPAIVGIFIRSPDNTTWVAEAASPADVNQIQAMIEAALAGRLNEGTYPVQGGTVAWTGTGLNFRVGAARYVLDGAEVTSAEQTIALDAADGTHPRIDVLTLDATGTLGKITGTPSAEPVKPTVEPSTHLEVTFVTVGAGATTPTDLTVTSVYAENLGTGGGEWAAVATDASVNVDSGSSPITGTKSVLGTAVPNGNGVHFTSGGTESVDDFGRLIFKIQPVAAWPTKKTLRLALMLTGTQRGAVVVVANGNYGFDSQSTAAQLLAIPISAFGVAAGTTFNRVRITVGGTGAAPSFRLDDVVLESGAGAGIPGSATVPPGGAAGTFLAKRSGADFDDEFRAIAIEDVVGLDAELDAAVAADAALDVRVDALEAGGAGLPAGGTVGQVLTKQSSTDGDADWEDPTGGSGGSSGPAVGARAYRDTAQSIPQTTFTAITFTGESVDTAAFIDLGTQATRITIPSGQGGKFVATAQLIFAVNATGSRFLLIYKNGSPVASSSAPASGSSRSRLSASAILDLVPGDYLELYAYQDSGGALNTDVTDAASGHVPSLAIARIVGPGGGSTSPTLASYRDTAVTSYTTNPEPVVDTTVKRNDGTTAMSVSFNLDVAADVRVNFFARLTKTNGETRVSIFDNGSKIWPADAVDSNNGWYSNDAEPAGGSTSKNIALGAVLALAAGSHVLDIRHQAAGNTNTVTWGHRTLWADVMSPNGSATGQAYWVAEHPDTMPGSANAKSDYWNDEAAQSGPVGGLNAKWTAVSAGSTRLFQHGRLYWKPTAADLKHMIVQAMPATPYKITTRLSLNSSDTALFAGIVFRASGDGKLMVFGLAPNAAGIPSFSAAHYSGPGAGTFIATDMTPRVAIAHPIYLRVKDDGTNFIFQASVEGGDADDHYLTLATVDRDSYLVTPNQIGLMVNGVDNTDSAVFGPFVVS
jgi:hypothetical protein